LKLVGSKQEFALFLKAEAVVIPEIAGNDGMIEGLPGDELLKLLPGVKTLKERSDRTIQNKHPQDQRSNDNDFHKVHFSFC
jgi:hypothetical protein